MLRSDEIQRITVKGILARNGKILLMKDEKGRWELPGGKIDFNEEPSETLKREFYEELGFKNISIGEVVNIWTFTVLSEGKKYQFIVIVYVCDSQEYDIQTSEEHVAFDWVPFNDINSLNIKDGYKESIEKYIKLMSK